MARRGARAYLAHEMRARAPLAPFWRAALVAFILAALTGALFRGALAWGWDAGTSLVHVRHAHSHLMLFGWTTPAAMILISARVAALRRRPVSRATAHVIGATLLLGLLSHPLFFVFGYETALIGPARVPPAVIVAGMNMLAWYAFAWRYAKETRGLARRGALFSWDLAIGVLVLSSLAAWSLAFVRPLGLDPVRWTPRLVHAFLDPFSEGWLVLVVLGLVSTRDAPRWPPLLVAIGAPLASLAAPSGELPEGLRFIGSAASLLWSAGLLVALAAAARRATSARARIPLALGALAALARIVAGVTPWVAWASMTDLRLFYLHGLLVGFVTLALVEAARASNIARAPILFDAALVLLLVSLVPLTRLWPPAWSGAWTMPVAAAVTLVPPSVLLASIARDLFPGHRSMKPAPSD